MPIEKSCTAHSMDFLILLRRGVTAQMKKIEKKTTFNLAFLILAFLLFPLNLIPVYSQEDPTVNSSTDDALDQELRYLQAETYVITASRIPESIKKTAASVTVVTDKQIRDMGARNLIDVLETVPGWGNYYHFIGLNFTTTRGVMHSAAGGILVMINSHPINENWSGGAFFTHDTMMLDNVKRIEFVRGPGSALYGANAFSGVINVITKEANDIDGWELISRGGSYDTQQYNLLYGKTHNDLEVVLNYNYFNTHGFNGHLNKDNLSDDGFPFVTDRFISLAPGRMQGDDDKYDVSLNLKYKGFTFDGKYVDRKRDLPTTWSAELSNRAENSFEDYYLNLSYERTICEGLDIKGKVYRNHNRYDLWESNTPGETILTPLLIPVIVPEGLIQINTAKNKRTGFEIQTNYTMGDSNTVVAGITYEEMKQYDVRSRRNSIVYVAGGIRIPLPRVVDLSDIQNWNRPVKRNFKAFFIEDIWNLTDSIRLTTGFRWDDYSDFGSEVSPHAGLTWEYAKGYDLKLLYGHAFRAPSFYELYDVYNGSPDLDPETIDTYQLSLGAQLTSVLNSRITWFRNNIKDSIFLKTEFEFPGFLHNINRDKIRTEGLELEMQYDLGRGSYLALNYRYMIHLKRAQEAFIPRHIGNIMANIRLSRSISMPPVILKTGLEGTEGIIGTMHQVMAS